MPNIVVVESKDKIQSVSKYLGDGYLVFASLGHVSDLPETGELGVNKKNLGNELCGHGTRRTSIKSNPSSP